MIKLIMSHSSDIGLVIAGLVIFTLLFLTIVLWTFRKRSKETYLKLAHLPLETEDSIG